ncbi:hypothetical protein [Paraburkholderia sp. MM5384-R2]|uniref:hypothetical protein n=1 Tax=Paraburkholderia sp. MM5384-R2 TaxID=2723097 RepID=UPI00162050EF|nr:hypothetical protein [Paraburkholderia sp. MM5384-R2]MBB5500643.1 hypothetical protein [Paraburkholderia sp. MM5384-R2]
MRFVPLGLGALLQQPIVDAREFDRKVDASRRAVFRVQRLPVSSRPSNADDRKTFCANPEAASSHPEIRGLLNQLTGMFVRRTGRRRVPLRHLAHLRHRLVRLLDALVLLVLCAPTIAAVVFRSMCD